MNVICLRWIFFIFSWSIRCWRHCYRFFVVFANHLRFLHRFNWLLDIHFLIFKWSSRLCWHCCQPFGLDWCCILFVFLNLPFSAEIFLLLYFSIGCRNRFRLDWLFRLRDKLFSQFKKKKKMECHEFANENTIKYHIGQNDRQRTFTI